VQGREEIRRARKKAIDIVGRCSEQLLWKIYERNDSDHGEIAQPMDSHEDVPVEPNEIPCDDDERSCELDLSSALTCQQQAEQQNRMDNATRLDLELIAKTEREAEAFLPEIEAFKGTTSDHNFIYLDEM